MKMTTEKAIGEAELLITDMGLVIDHLKGTPGKPGGVNDQRALTLRGRIDAVGHLIESTRMADELAVEAENVLPFIGWLPPNAEAVRAPLEAAIAKHAKMKGK